MAFAQHLSQKYIEDRRYFRGGLSLAVMHNIAGNA